MGNFGIGEMAVIAIFGLLVFGPQRLPEIARSIGGFIRELKDTTGNLTKEFNAEMNGEVPKAKAPQTNGAVRNPVNKRDEDHLA